MPKKNCKDNELNIAVLDNRVKSVEYFVKEMNENHLPHIYEALKQINNKIVSLNIWDRIKSVALIVASGMIGAMGTYIFLK